MTTNEAITALGGPRKLAEALGITREAVYQWGDHPPPLRVYQIRELLAKRQAAESAGNISEQATSA